MRRLNMTQQLVKTELSSLKRWSHILEVVSRIAVEQDHTNSNQKMNVCFSKQQINFLF